jgi:hypothetical protein
MHLRAYSQPTMVKDESLSHDGQETKRRMGRRLTGRSLARSSQAECLLLEEDVLFGSPTCERNASLVQRQSDASLYLDVRAFVRSNRYRPCIDTYKASLSGDRALPFGYHPKPCARHFTR